MDNQSVASQEPAVGSSTSVREQFDDSEHIIASKELERHHHAHPLAEEKQSNPVDKMKADLEKLISDLDSTQVSRKNKEEAQGILTSAIEKASDKVKTRDDSSCSSDSGRSTPIELNINEAESMHHLKEVRYKSKRVDLGGELLDEDSDEDHVTAIRESHHNDQKYGFTWREKEDRHHKITSIEANIHCPALRKVLATNLAHVPFIHWSRPQLMFHDPFPEIVTNWRQLRKAAEIQQAAGGCGTHLCKLLDYIAETSQVKRYLSQEKNTDQNRIVRFRDLSLYFRPGEMMFANVGDQPRAFLLFRGLMSWRQSKSTDSNDPLNFDLFAWKYDFDGISFSRDPFLIRIPSFNSPRNITALPCYPLRYHPNHDAIRQKLIQRGGQYLYACTQEKEKKMFHYTGVLHYKSKLPAEIFDSQYAMPITEGAVLGGVLGRKLRENEAEGASPPTDEANLDEENEEESQARIIHYSGSVIVDPGLYRRYGPLLMPKFRATSIPQLWKYCECVECQSNEAMREVLKNKYDNVSKTESGWQKFDDEQRLICPDKVEGFALGNKKWVYLDVSSECLHEVQNKDRPVGGPQPSGSSDCAFNKIILPKDKSWDETKEMVEELVRTHGKDLKGDSSVPNPFEDLIEGKGQGLVVLLYGSSGVGKTLMAESVAEFVGRPLLRVNMSDISLNISNVEKTLEQLFNMAVRWGAVLLFDEADIFLARRTSGGGEDLTRNAIVGVFLNALDYYSGILFLTTNRLIPFDTAVLSRIHLAIEFLPFDKAARKALAIQFLSQIKTTAIEPAVYDWIESVSGSNLNGRQIRNVISAATTLARAHKRPLQIADLQKFWDRAEHFQQQMQNEIFLSEQAMLPHASMRSRY